MTKPKINIDQFTYELPDERIAKYPLANRDASKLLVYNNGTVSDRLFSDITNLIPPDAMMVFNNTKVIRARLHFRKSTGANIEIFCLEPSQLQDVQESFSSTTGAKWRCIIGNSKKWKDGKLSKTVDVEGTGICFEAERDGEEDGTQIISFTWNNSSVSFGEIIDQLGQTPIPPYLNRESEEIDEERYQTVYSQHKGSVAAPTAGLHFTQQVLEKLQAKGVKTAKVTLHVGAGTFKPVKSATIDGHDMHTESFQIDKQTIEALLSHQGPLIAVGTTSVRTLESLYWLAVNLFGGNTKLNVAQWDAYTKKSDMTYKEALTLLLEYMEANNLSTLNAHTSIMIAPGYQFKAVNALITNFHQPQSTLLLLIGALIGDDWKRLYAHALLNNYRFLSYGDSSLLFKNSAT